MQIEPNDNPDKTGLSARNWAVIIAPVEHFIRVEVEDLLFIKQLIPDPERLAETTDAKQKPRVQIERLAINGIKVR